MSVGYAITVLVLWACTLCALRPLRSQGPFGTATYLVGMVWNELPVLAIGLVISPVLLALAQGDLDTPSELVARALLLPVIAGLGWALLRAIRSVDVPERAMTEALGTRWRADIAPSLATGLRTRVPLGKVLLLPFLRRSWSVRRIPNLPYAEGGRRHRLDVYRHRSKNTGSPVLVHFHGGRFASGAKNRESLPLLHRLGAAAGCVSARTTASAHRLVSPTTWSTPSASWPGCAPTASSTGPTRRRCSVAGQNSAGGYLAAFAALTPNEPEYQPGFADADTSVSAAIGLYGYYGQTDADRPESSPRAHMEPARAAVPARARRHRQRRPHCVGPGLRSRPERNLGAAGRLHRATRRPALPRLLRLPTRAAGRRPDRSIRGLGSQPAPNAGPVTRSARHTPIPAIAVTPPGIRSGPHETSWPSAAAPDTARTTAPAAGRGSRSARGHLEAGFRPRDPGSLITLCQRTGSRTTHVPVAVPDRVKHGTPPSLLRRGQQRDEDRCLRTGLSG